MSNFSNKENHKPFSNKPQKNQTIKKFQMQKEIYLFFISQTKKEIEIPKQTLLKQTLEN